jgi:hypothetical protein
MSTAWLVSVCRTFVAVAGVVLMSTTLTGCLDSGAWPGSAELPRDTNSLLPQGPAEGEEPWHLGSGATTGTGPEQPIAFPHHTHVTVNKMQCEYCHSVARKSIHAGVPETAVCMNCHQYIKKDSPEIRKVAEYWARKEPIPWKKVHDMPDFVYFSHERHVRGGVQCTECHGQVGLQGQATTWTEVDAAGNAVEKTGVKVPMIRETTMQMGWCLDCHGTHPKIDENYGDQADLRRAELKDCWTCHK